MTSRTPNIRRVTDRKQNLLAIILSSEKFGPGVHFVTPNELQQQVAVMKRPAGEKILAHTHLPVPRSVKGTQEVLIILKGSLRADIYDDERKFVQSETLVGGDVIVLVSGGHGFAILDDCEFIEVKQGPYVPGKDKEVFEKDDAVS